MQAIPKHSVAIIIAAYNAGATVQRAIISALAEPEVQEIYVIDDASQDDTAQQAQLADDGSGRLTIIHRASNGGPSAARNMALALAKSAWVGVLDADDFFLPGRMAALLAEAENADLIAEDMWQVSARDINGPRVPLLADGLSEPMQVDFVRFVGSAIPRKGRARGELSFIKPLMRRVLLEQHGVRYQEPMRLGEDFELYARLLGLGGRLVIVPHRGYVSVVRANSLSAVHSTQDLEQLRDCHDVLCKELKLSAEEAAILVRHRDAVDCRVQWRRLIDAVKARDVRAACSCFNASWRTRRYLVSQLMQQAYLRLRFGNEKARAMVAGMTTARHETR